MVYKRICVSSNHLYFSIDDFDEEDLIADTPTLHFMYSSPQFDGQLPGDIFSEPTFNKNLEDDSFEGVFVETNPVEPAVGPTTPVDTPPAVIPPPPPVFQGEEGLSSQLHVLVKELLSDNPEASPELIAVSFKGVTINISRDSWAILRAAFPNLEEASTLPTKADRAIQISLSDLTDLASTSDPPPGFEKANNKAKRVKKKVTSGIHMPMPFKKHLSKMKKGKKSEVNSLELNHLHDPEARGILTCSKSSEDNESGSHSRVPEAKPLMVEKREDN
ncbi:uncharacterized protein A4U43_C10F11680 [Asparagus officinalis]|uniref:Uncharacterized protein n=1 Tax=Asparagus officinalis TaxID=4686 RepID=A0A5P1E2F4_ASPOF|nr:uncharacterized protein A4U43_C10F11680 [Asparagus officinalis]